MSISSVTGTSSAAALSAVGSTSGTRPAATGSPAASASALAVAQAGSATAAATVSVSIPGSPFTLQERTSPGSLVVTPQIPPLLFDSSADSLLSSTTGSLVDTTA